MQAESKQVPDDPGTERLVVLQVLDRDWSPTELLRELHDVDPEAVSGAIRKLDTLGVLVLDDERVRASPAVMYLDSLGLITV
jgi:hypothetical protein